MKNGCAFGFKGRDCEEVVVVVVVGCVVVGVGVGVGDDEVK
jgi:hypothetical protein